LAAGQAAELAGAQAPFDVAGIAAKAPLGRLAQLLGAGRVAVEQRAGLEGEGGRVLPVPPQRGGCSISTA
jgi:hypothetical protein